MSESGDYSPGDWKGYDFDNARKAYDVHVGRSYNEAKKDNKRVSDLIPLCLETNSPAPLVILCDVTGSMGNWPAVIFSKLPYLDNECKEYLGEDMEVSFAATGDMQDSYPLQVRAFHKGRELETQLKELVIEGGGSGPESAHEAYELAALYYSRNVKMPQAKHPILIFIADEFFHDTIDQQLAKVGHIDIKKTHNTMDVFEELKKKFAVYVIRKPYSGADDEINKQWTMALGEDHIAMLDDPSRVVDVIFGILAKETDKIKYFKQEIEERQNAGQVATVYKSLKTIHMLPEDASKSVMHTTLKGKLTKKLLP